MALGLVGEKKGMTRLFMPDGESIPVTVIEVLPNYVTKVNTLELEGYTGVQVTTGTRRASRVTKPMKGHFEKAGVTPGRGLWEFTLPADEIASVTLGDENTVALFDVDQYVDVTAVSRGKGFAGTVKRHNFKTQDASHGNSLSHRVPGSIGQNQSPRHVFKNKKMAGQMGNTRCTIQNQKIVKIDEARNLILVKGQVPGAPGANVIIKHAVKMKTKKETASHAS